MRSFLKRNAGLSLKAFFLILTFSQAAANELRLADLLQASEKENPDLRVLESKLSALEAKSRGATDIPAPMVGISYMGANGPFRSKGMDEDPSFEVSQKIPFPTKIFSSKAAANSRYISAKTSQDYERQIINASVKIAFWNYYLAFHERKYKIEQLQVIKNHLKHLSRRFVSDTLTNSHILSMKNRLSMIELDVEDSELALTKARNTLFVFTGLSINQLNGDPEEAPLAKVPTENEVSETLLVKSANAQVELSKSELSLAKTSYLPDFTIKYKWNSRFAARPSNQEIMLGMDLPFVFFWQPQAKVREANAQLIESKAMQTKALRESEAELSNLATELSIKRRKIERLDSDIIPRSEQRLKLAHSISYTDMQSLTEHREILEGNLEFKLEKARLRSEFEKQIAELEALRGEG